MAKVMIKIRSEVKVKMQAQKIAKALGIPLSTIIHAYLKQFVRTKEVYSSPEETLRIG